jgi:hypothetical protein
VSHGKLIAEWILRVEVAMKEETLWEVFVACGERAGEMRSRTLRGRRSLREDEPGIARNRGTVSLWNTVKVGWKQQGHGGSALTQ